MFQTNGTQQQKYREVKECSKNIWDTTSNIYLVVCTEFFAIGCEGQQSICCVNQTADL